MAGNVLEYCSPSRAGLISRYTINVFSPEMIGLEMLAYGAPTVSSTATGANAVIHHPLILPYPFTVNQFFWVNGSAVAGNTDIGVYTEDGASLLASSGAVLNAGASALQVVDVTNVTLPANRRLWLSLGATDASQQYTRFSLTAPASDYIGIKTMASGISGTLVTPATFAIGANTCIWCGMTSSATL